MLEAGCLTQGRAVANYSSIPRADALAHLRSPELSLARALRLRLRRRTERNAPREGLAACAALAVSFLSRREDFSSSRCGLRVLSGKKRFNTEVTETLSVLRVKA